MIDFEHVSKTYGGIAAVDDLSLSISEGEFCVLIGPSGSGKSTTLKMINRLIEHDSGRILFAGEEIRSFAPEAIRRRMGYAIQSIGLFPHWTVEENIGAVPSLLKWPKAKIRDRVTELLKLLGLDPGRYRDRYPSGLSGGQQQRIGVARALAADPEVLLMDEPFGALDPITRESLQNELLRIHNTSGKTIVLVTHDIDEALRLATRIVLLRRGQIVDDGSPIGLLTHPANPFVTEFFGREEIGIKRLSVETVASRQRPSDLHDDARIAASASLRQALSKLVELGADRLAVEDERGAVVGTLHLADIVGPPPETTPVRDLS